jgi:hypothetical protein
VSVFLPCLTPWGVAWGRREGRAGLDPNRGFDDPTAPLARIGERPSDLGEAVLVAAG